MLRAMDDGGMVEPLHYRRGEGGVLALHPSSLHDALASSQPSVPSPAQIGRLFRVGLALAPEVVVAAQRLPFGASLGRRRGYLVSEPHARSLALLAQ
jgi:hypothetical protein